MTATAPPTASIPAAAARQPRYLAAAEIGLLAVTATTVVGFARVFEDSAFLPSMLMVAVVAHALSWAARRRGLSVPITALIALPTFVVVTSWLFFFDTTIFAIPTATTLDAARQAFSESWETFQNIVAPAPTQTGFVLTSCIALYFAVFLADWAAFRLWSAFEAIVPATTLFVFCSLFGTGDERVAITGVFAGASLAFLLLHRTAKRETSAGWLTTDVSRGSDAVVRAGAAMAAVAVIAGAIIGPSLPGAGSPPIVPWHADNTSRTRTVISPLVNIKDRLVNQTDTEVFTVESDQPQYWRLTALDEFKGDAWKSSGTYNAADGDLHSQQSEATSSEIHQTFHITNLTTLWAPAAFLPVRLESSSKDLRYQPESATLIVSQDEPVSDGMTYTVVSRSPSFDPAQLGAVSADDIPTDIKDRYVALPTGFSATARATALDVTKQAENPYTKALALENFFSGPTSQFRYDLNVPEGHSDSAIDDFLETRKGYCEQFAGAYAAMARSIGLPARVAVGFTQGTSDPAQPNLYRVTGRYAHAWPEVYLGAKFGWVPFEPTPGRGAPNTQAWTNRATQQAAPTGPGNAVTIPSGVSPSSAASPTLPGGDPGQVSADAATTTTVRSAATTTTAPASVTETAVKVAAGGGVSLLTIAIIAGAYLAAVLALKTAVRRRRRAAARDASAAVLVAWHELLDALTLFGLKPLPTETDEEFALRAEPYLEHLAPAVLGLAADVEAASFAPDVVSPDVAERAERITAAVADLVRERATTLRQWQDRFDPRPVLAGHRGH